MSEQLLRWSRDLVRRARAGEEVAPGLTAAQIIEEANRPVRETGLLGGRRDEYEQALREPGIVGDQTRARVDAIYRSLGPDEWRPRYLNPHDHPEGWARAVALNGGEPALQSPSPKRADPRVDLDYVLGEGRRG